MQLPGQVAPPCESDRPMRGAVTTQPNATQLQTVSLAAAPHPRWSPQPTLTYPLAPQIDFCRRSAGRLRAPSAHARTKHALTLSTTHGTRLRRADAPRNWPLQSHPSGALRARLARLVRAKAGPIAWRVRLPGGLEGGVSSPVETLRPRSAPVPVPRYGPNRMHGVPHISEGPQLQIRRVWPPPEVPASCVPSAAWREARLHVRIDSWFSTIALLQFLHSIKASLLSTERAHTRAAFPGTRACCPRTGTATWGRSRGSAPRQAWPPTRRAPPGSAPGARAWRRGSSRAWRH